MDDRDAKAELGLHGSAVRQDGRSASLTAPNGQAQQGLLLAALGDAGVTPSELTLNEAHGTGTALGDPIEAGSLAAAVIEGREPLVCSLPVGGIKANVGHAEPAAGMTGALRLAVGLAPRLAVRLPSPLHRAHLRAPLQRTALSSWPPRHGQSITCRAITTIPAAACSAAKMGRSRCTRTTDPHRP